MVKRKLKKKINRAIIPNVFLQNYTENKNDVNASLKSKLVPNSEHNIVPHIIQQTVDGLHKKKELNTLVSPRYHKQKIINPDSKKNEVKKIPVHIKKKYKTDMKKKHTLNKHKKTKVNQDVTKNVGGTDSVCKRSKMVAQKVEDFLNHTKKINLNAIQTKHAYKKDNQNAVLLQENYCSISDIIHQPSKTDKYVIEKYFMNKLKAKSYKTTYDLVQTILKSQEELLSVYSVENSMSKELYRKFHRPGICRAPKQYTRSNRYICSEYSNNDGNQEKDFEYATDFATQYKISSKYEENFNEYLSVNEEKKTSENMITNVSEILQIKDKENIFSQNQNSYCAQQEKSYSTLCGSLKVTYDSHQYDKKYCFVRNDTTNCYTVNKQQNVRFITKESRANFATSYDLTNKYIKPFKPVSTKQKNTFDVRMKQTIEESYTIEYSKSNENNDNTIHNYILENKPDFILDNDYYKHNTVSYDNVSPKNYVNTVLGNTYTIHSLNSLFDETVTPQNQMKERRHIQPNGLFETYSVHNSFSEINNDNNVSNIIKDDLNRNSKNLNIVFVSKTQHSEIIPSDNNMIVEPINVCETVFNDIGSNEKEFAFSFNENNQHNDSLYGNIKNGRDKHIENEHVNGNDDIEESVSHHFSCAVKHKLSHFIDNIIDNNLEDPMETNQNKIENIVIGSGNLSNEGNMDAEDNDCNIDINFNIKNRPRFVPKGNIFIFLEFLNTLNSTYLMKSLQWNLFRYVSNLRELSHKDRSSV